MLTQRYKVHSAVQKMAPVRFTPDGIATNLQFVKNAASAKHDKARDACTMITFIFRGRKGTDRLTNMPKTTQPVAESPWNQEVWLRSLCSEPHTLLPA